RNIIPFVAQPPPHPITVYASHPPSPTTAQHSLPGGALPPYRGRSFTGRNASASPDAPELNFRIHSPPADSPSLLRVRLRPKKEPGFPPLWRPCGAAVSAETRKARQHRAEEG